MALFAIERPSPFEELLQLFDGHFKAESLQSEVDIIGDENDVPVNVLVWNEK